MPTTTFNFANGVTGTPAYGQQSKVIFGNEFLDGDFWTMLFTSTQGDFTIGVGNVALTSPVFGLTFNNRMYLANGVNFNFSAIDDATGWEEQDIGAGFVPVLKKFGVQDEVFSLSPFQGKLAVFGRHTTSIFRVDADPDNFNEEQTLRNTGTVAPQSTQSLGDLDVLFLSDTGIRSLRARETTLNAFSVDIGSPIDAVIQTVLAGLTDDEKATAQSIVEPTAKRYWLYLDGLIYVLSNFALSKIVAWSTYVPEILEEVTITGDYDDSGNKTQTGLTASHEYIWIQGTADTSVANGSTTVSRTGRINATVAGELVLAGTAEATCTAKLFKSVRFVVKKFVLVNNLVYMRVLREDETTTERLLIFGGTNGTTYDYSLAKLRLPWMDAKTPATIKSATGVDVTQSGQWSISFGTDYINDEIHVVRRGTYSTQDEGRIPVDGNSTHFSLEAVTLANTSASVSNLIFHYQTGDAQ